MTAQNLGKTYDINKGKPEVRSHEYVIGDVHGCFDEFKQLVNKILSADNKAHFILVGDIIDRGGKTIDMLKWAMQNVNRENSRFKMILGNHEYIKIDYLEEYLRLRKDGTIKEAYGINSDHYNLMDRLKFEHISDEEIEKILEFFKSLPVYYETYSMLKRTDGTVKKQHFIIVHGDLYSAFINKDETFRKSCLTKTFGERFSMLYGEQPIEKIVWDRNYFGHPNLKHTILIHGHTPTILDELICRGAAEGKIDYRQNDINIDCGIAYDLYTDQANLAAIKLDDLSEIYLYDKTPNRACFGNSKVCRGLMLGEHLEE
jgi:hypothetical protein